jgi:alpha-tubulin suppressor-like RCC1 family protein
VYTQYIFCIVVVGAVYTWGDGDYGKLGRGGSDGSKSPKIVPYSGKKVTFLLKFKIL